MKHKLRNLLTVAVLTGTLSTGIFSVGGEAVNARSLNHGSHTNQPEALSQSKLQQLLARMRGRASWYGPRFQGRRTANGERFNPSAYTAAHRSLPFGTKVKVINLRNRRSVVVRINDRGPYVRGRIIDLSKAAARSIGMIGQGTAPVRLQVISR